MSAITAVYGAEEEPAPDEILEVPSLEFLEFLGSFETDEGEWIDPESLMTEEFIELLDVAPIYVPEGQENSGTDSSNRRNRQ